MNRDDYMEGRVSHQDYYLALADVIGRKALEGLVLHIASKERITEALKSDEHLNNIPLAEWDRLDPMVRDLVAGNAKAVMAISWTGQPLKPGTFCWSLAESGCVLKAVARDMALSLADES